MKIYTFLKYRQNNKWCSLKKFDFLNRIKKKRDGGSNPLSIMAEIQQIPIVDKLFFQISMSKMLIKDSQKNKKNKKSS